MENILTLVFTAILLFFTVIGLIAGLTRGLKKSLIRLGIVVLSAVLAVVLSLSCASAILHKEIGEYPDSLAENLTVDGAPQPADTPLIDAIENVMKENDAVADLTEIAPTLTAFIMVTPQVLISEFLFLFMFFVLKLLLGIPEAILKAIFLREKGKKKRRGFGALVGAVQGVFCACVVLVPIFGILSLTGTAVGAVKALPEHEHGESADLIETIELFEHDFLAPLQSDPTYRVLKTVGVEHLCVETFYTLSNATHNGAKICYFREVNDVLPVLMPFVEIAELDFENMTEADVDFLKDLISSLNDSHLVSATISEVVTNTSQMLLDGEDVFGMTLPEGETDAFLLDVLDTLANAAPESVPVDLPHMVEVVDVMIAHNMFEGGEELTLAALVTDKAFTEDFLLALSHSTLLSPIAISAVNDFGIGQIADLMNAPSNNDEAYDFMLNYVMNIFSNMQEESVDYAALDDEAKEEYVYAVYRIFDGCSKNVENEAAYTAAARLLDQFAGSVPTIEQLAGALDTMGVAELTRAGFSTEMVLYQDLMITDKYLFNHMTEAEREAEAEHLAQTIADVFALLDGVDEDFANVSLDTLGPVGKILDSMNNTQLLSASLSNVLNLFMDTAYTLRAIPDPAIELLRNKINDGHLRYENLFINIASTYKIANHIDVTGKGNDESGAGDSGDTTVTPEETEDFKQTIENLYNTTDEETLEITQAIITEEFLTGMGVPVEGASTAQAVFNTFLEEVVNTKTDESTDFEAESKAIESVMTIVTNVSSGNTTETINEELLDAVVASDTLTNTIISASQKEEADLSQFFDEEMLESAITVLDDYAAKVAENATPEDAEKINACLDALRGMIGLEIPV